MINLFSTTEIINPQIALSKTLKSNQFPTGKFVLEFEERFSQSFNKKFGVSVDTSTNALIIALKLLNLKRGDEVLTQSYSCLSTTSAITAVGAKPKWVDVDQNTAGIDIKDLEKKISKKTRVLVLYHMCGYSSNIQKIKSICKKANIKIIEDCNNAFGGKYMDQPLGSFSDISVFSFYSNRHLSCIEGGMLLLNSSKHYTQAVKLRRFGINESTFRDSCGEFNSKSQLPIISTTSRMNNLSAAFCLNQMDILDRRIKSCVTNAQRLKKYIEENCSRIELIQKEKRSIPGYWVLLAKVSRKRDFIESMKINGVQVASIHYPNHKYLCYEESCKKNLSSTKIFEKELVGLPCGWWLNQADLDKIEKSLSITNSK